MKKISIIYSILIFVISIGFSQKNEKQVNFYNDVKFGEQYGVLLSTNNAVSKFNYAKLGLVINNKTDDYILFYKDKCKFIFNENSYSPKTVKKGKIVRPNKKRTFTVKTAKETNYLVDYFSFKPGGIYTFPAKGVSTEVESFHLPATKNIIEVGSFKINMLKLKKETQETIIKFECTYTGDKVAVISPANCVIKTEDGKEWAPKNSKEKTIILQKNDKTRFNLFFEIPAKSVDMQFAEMDIVWKNTFSESDIKELNFDIKTIEKDIIKTKKEN